MTENEIIEGCKQKNATFQRELFNRYKDAMFTLAYRLSGDFDDAKDILQEAFIEVFQQIQHFRGESTIGAWIKIIVSRKAYKFYKSKIRFIDYDSLPENQLIEWGDSIAIQHLEKAIQQLPDGFRLVFVMAEIEGFKHKEIAEFLGISEGTSKSQLFYAKKKLKEFLSEWSNER